MGLFVCDECGVIDNTAITRYWLRNNPDPEIGTGGKALCSQCDPQTGKWHGHFPRRQWDGKREVANR